MRQALFVAGEPEVTRGPAAALLGVDVHQSALPRQDSEAGWRAARAHSLLEARTLVDMHPPPFSVVAVAPRLPDGSGLSLISDFQRPHPEPTIPVLLLTQRGRDHHIRRQAAMQHQIAGFLNLPVTTDHIRTLLAQAEGARRVLMVGSSHPSDEACCAALAQATFELRGVRSTAEAETALPDFSPHVVVLSLRTPLALKLCTALKRRENPPLVILVGPISNLKATLTEDNRWRADDYLATPTDEALIVDRVAALVGWGARPRRKAPRRRPSRASSIASTSDTHEDDNPLLSLASAPRRSSPIPVLTARRSGRRVPCNVQSYVENEGQRWVAQTLDISPGGIFINCERFLPVETLVRLRFTLFPDAPPVEAEGRVAWIAEGISEPYGVGIEFWHPPPDSPHAAGLRQVVEYVNRVSRVIYQPD